MKKKYILLLFCISFFINGCITKDNETTFRKESTQTLDSYEQVKDANDNSINANTVNENYETYSGYWTVDGISHDTLISDGGTEFSVTITNENELKGYLFSQQGISERIADIDNIKGKIENSECYYDFDDDGWEGAGTLYIQFLESEIIIEVQNYKMSENNLSGFGMNGVYRLIRANKALEKNELETEMLEQELLNTVYDKYYSHWSEESMLAAIKERNLYLKRCSFYKEVIEYMENVREVKDIAYVVEPLYYTDMKYYESRDFENEPLFILHLAKNEIYARHGYIFKNEDLNNYFMGQLWYEPSCMPEDFEDDVFNEYEKANLKLLADLDMY